MLERVFMLGATGTIGRATVRALRRRGHEVVCMLRPASLGRDDREAPWDGAHIRYGDTGDCLSILHEGMRRERFDTLISCMASRSGAPDDAWAVDYQAHLNALQAAQQVGVSQMILLSALCVQKPLLDFQQAKLAFERQLIDSGLNYSIVRPTAFFKSLSGQLDRLRRGKPFVVFGDGRLTACKPISDEDVADYLVGCIGDVTRHRAVLPIGGPGPALTPMVQGHLLFEALGLTPRFKHVPVGLLDGIVKALDLAGTVLPPLKKKAALARIGRYYATESMLVLNPTTGLYDEQATPSTGRQSLGEFYRELATGRTRIERGDHAVF